MIAGCQHTVVTTHSFSRFAKFQHPVPSRLACGMGDLITKSKEAKVLPKPCKSLFLIEKIIEIDFFFFFSENIHLACHTFLSSYVHSWYFDIKLANQ